MKWIMELSVYYFSTVSTKLSEASIKQRVFREACQFQFCMLMMCHKREWEKHGLVIFGKTFEWRNLLAPDRTVRNSLEWILTTDVLNDCLKSHIFRWRTRIRSKVIQRFQSLAWLHTSRLFLCLSVSPFPSILVATSTNPWGTLWDLGFTDLRRATSKWNTLLWGTAYAVVETRVGSGRFVTSLFLSPPRSILNSEFGWNRWKSFLWSHRVPIGAYISRVEGWRWNFPPTEVPLI